MAFLESIRTSAWQIDMEINGHKERFGNTGAEVMVVSQSTHKSCGSPNLRKAKRVLRGPGQDKLQATGEFMGTLKLGERKFKQPIFVVKGLHRSLLGQPAIEASQLICTSRGHTKQFELTSLKGFR